VILGFQGQPVVLGRQARQGRKVFLARLGRLGLRVLASLPVEPPVRFSVSSTLRITIRHG
jgi:hypothetical protein